ncbi:hypothetical protein OROGR_012987 [Orobanche gracilis]
MDRKPYRYFGIPDFGIPKLSVRYRYKFWCIEIFGTVYGIGKKNRYDTVCHRCGYPIEDREKGRDKRIKLVLGFRVLSCLKFLRWESYRFAGEDHTNPQNLVEKILRTKKHQSTYWKEPCFGLTAETLGDTAMKLDHLGGTHSGNRKPTPFMCLPMKMLQIQPDKEIVVEIITNPEYK